ncbi:uncharacterized protein ColSpa_02899 [Colletotrichum spaethianum]|uniref:Uncharacterized protein n=1 Tax=Colletotrichum spaethianum TaxID=700344 RepID=A0AA37L6D8_9PEZI|nr:uncharacterized protein ColSpa_02899 [Colletotrichum spaethianum]GKT42718.1 hypothetical protein ColSpa_02899 [Colletotrichum spaethianum]
MAIFCLRSLIGDEPVTNAIHSIKRIVWAVEQSINASKSKGAFLDVASTESSPMWSDDRFPTNIQFPSLEENRANTTTSDDLIFFSNRAYRPQPEPVTDYAMPVSGAGPVMNPFSDLNFDVLTTDLFNFFPVDTNAAPSTHR